MRGWDRSRAVTRDGRKILEKPSQKGVPYVTYVNTNVAVYIPVHGAKELLLRKTTMPLASCLLELIHAAHRCILASVSQATKRMRP